MKTIVKIVFGSHLYGTNTPESDLDYKGVFVPDTRDILLGKIPKTFNADTNKTNTKNTVDDVDCEMYSLHYFLKLCSGGQTVAFDMLHAPKNMIVEQNYLWDAIVSKRQMFYTKNLKAFVGYAKAQAARYGIKGSRLDAVSRVCDYLKTPPESTRMFEIWDFLPTGEHIHFTLQPSHNKDQRGILREYEVCNRKVQETCTVGYAHSVFLKYHNQYGERAKAAKMNMNIDWKAVSHAIRVSYELEEIYKQGTITFPLIKADFISEVKAGKLSYTDVIEELERSVDEVGILAEKSEYPSKTDRKYWESFLLNVIKSEIYDDIMDAEYPVF